MRGERFHCASHQDQRRAALRISRAGAHLRGTPVRFCVIPMLLIMLTPVGNELNQRDGAVDAAAVNLVTAWRLRCLADGTAMRCCSRVRVRLRPLRRPGVRARRDEAHQAQDCDENAVIHGLAMCIASEVPTKGEPISLFA